MSAYQYQAGIERIGEGKVTVTATQLSPLKLHTLAYSVIPSGGGETGKAPLINWTEYQTRQPTDAEIEAWETKLNPPLWGIVTGAVSGIVVIDVDKPDEYKIFETQGLKPHFKTPRGGYHYYFKHPDFTVKTKAGLLPGLDIRGDGGFVNVTGTNPKTGKSYETLIIPIPDNVYPWEKVPASILKLILQDTRKATGANSAEPIKSGERNATLASVAGRLRRDGATQSEIEARLLRENKERCDPPLPDTEVLTIAGSIARYEPDPDSLGGNGHKPGPVNMPELRGIDTIAPQTVTWLWKPYIPFGKLTLFEGDPGAGKSWASLAIATALSLGTALPYGEPLPNGPIIIATAEDGLADTIRPRLDLMGADLSSIKVIDGLFTLDDTGFSMLEKYITEVMPGLVIIDPLVAYLSGEVDIHKANQVRQATARLARLADTYGSAILAIRHLTKGGSLKPIYRGLGSIDFTAAARSVLLAGIDPDTQARGIVHIKCNLAPLGEAVGFELKDGGFYWTATSDLTAGKILAPDDGSGGSAGNEAEAFLLDALSGGESIASEIFNEASAQGISEATIKRAKARLNIITFKETGKGRAGKWLWKLPEK